MKYLAQQPGGLTDEQFKTDPSISVRDRNWFKVDWNLIALKMDYYFSKDTRLNWRTYTLQGDRQALGILSYINRPDNGGPRDHQSDKYQNYGSELRFIHQYKMSGEAKSTFLAGARYYNGLTIRKQGAANDGKGADFDFIGPEPDNSFYKFPGRNVALFAENIFQISRNWSITPGIRFEHINTKANGYYYKQNVFIANEKIRRAERKSPLLYFVRHWYRLQVRQWYGAVCKHFTELSLHQLQRHQGAECQCKS